MLSSAELATEIGAVLGLLLTSQAFSIVVIGIGIIAVAGVVVNGYIDLVETHDRLRRHIVGPRGVILRTGRLRLRTVVLSAVTAVLVLMPIC
ncbi:efflux RND transporter permease subunit [Hydrocarboniclastica marina]|uniref:Uncharacterized protein n=1 Tax=Hydrocarboniclastica marina TaxID=2259620 RepID=A0A4P7XGM3_9ALTE|nr:efflux RND transporter permease subunit [Hydrocarboniclastica marina]QCF26158.1 hypothetical protein soil367_09560 [Hydrocarboniclastica marina]